jgi:TP901 family phage tail tape measure protein
MSDARPARIDLTVDPAGLERGLRDARKDLRNFDRDAERQGRRGSRGDGGFFSRSAKKAGEGMLQGLGQGLAMMTGGGIASGLSSIAGDVMDLERGMTRYQIATDSTPEAMNAFRASLSAVSKDSGIARSALLGGASAYVALTGDAAGASAQVETFAKVANATGASMEDIAATAASMKQNLGIDPKDFKAGFSALSVQGKAGAVELKELASLLAGLAPSFSKFDGGTGTEGLAEMGAALQVVRQGFGSSSEAATGLQSYMVSLTKNAAKFKAIGVHVFDKHGKTRDFRDILDEISHNKAFQGEAGQTKLQKIFGRDEAVRAFQQMVQNRALLDELITKSSDRAAIDRDAATYQESAAGRLDKAWNNIKTMIAEAFTPERIAKFLSGMEKIVDALGSIVDGWNSLFGSGDDGAAQEAFGWGPQSVAATKLWWDNANKAGAGGMLSPISWDQADAQVAAATQDLLNGNMSRKDREAVRWIAPGSATDKLATMASYRDPRLGPQEGGFADQMAARTDITVPVTVKLDGDVVAKGSANARYHRNRPGGR